MMRKNVMNIRKMVSMVLSAVMFSVLAFSVLVVPQEAQAADQYLYVSPSGSGTLCTLAAPCSLTGGRDKVRTMNSAMTGNIIVYLRGGTYALTAPFQLTESTTLHDSGTNGFNIIYQAYPGEIPVLNGGTTVTGWTQVPNTNQWVASVPAGTNTRELYVNGSLAVRARSVGFPALGFGGITDDPNMVFYNLIETVTTYQGAMPVYQGYDTTATYANMNSWGNVSDIEFVYDVVWTHVILPVQSITAAGSGARIIMKSQPFRDAQIKGGVHVGDPSYMENAYELLDQPGEWYLNRTTQQLYYIPKANENMATVEVVAPVLEQFVNVAGTLDTPVHNIQFQGLNFSYATFLRPSVMGHAEVQANMIKDPAEDTIVHSSFIKSTASVVLDAAKSITFERNNFSKIGGAVINIQNGSENNIIRGSTLTQIGGNGIIVGDFTRFDAHPTDVRAIVKNNTIINNYFDRIAQIYTGGAAITVGYTDGTVISHNEIRNTSYTGISLGWGWGYWDQGGRSDAPAYYPVYTVPTVAKNNRIEYNKIHHTMQALVDGGAIYTLGMMPLSSIKYNYYYDNDYFGIGLYNDEGTGGLEITGNTGCGANVPNTGGRVAVSHWYNPGAEAYMPGIKATNTFNGNSFDAPAYFCKVPLNVGIEDAYADIIPLTVLSLGNIAPEATVTSSSDFNASFSAAKAVDGVIGINDSGEWASLGELNPWIQTTWRSLRTINRVILYDRVLNTADVNAGVLSFSDGSSINISGIKKDGLFKEIYFPSKTVTWVKFQVTGGTGNNVGLSEFQIFETAKNIAPQATATASSIYNANFAASKVNDNVIGINLSGEWASLGELNPWVQLTWNNVKTINKVTLFDRVDMGDNANAGTLFFSDGTSIAVTGVPAGGGGKEISFQNKSVTWVKFQTTGGVGPNVGMSEIQVFEAPLNIAPQATATASSSNSVYVVTMVNDNIFGYAANNRWESLGELNPWLQLTWNSTRTVNKITIYDIEDGGADANGGILSFSDGSSIAVSGIDRTGAATEVSFATKYVTWVKLQMTGGTGANVGLMEMQVMEDNNSAVDATATASSEYNANYAAIRANDSFVGLNVNGEWASLGELNPWLQLTWNSSKVIDKVVLFDRVLTEADANSGTLSFSDGSNVSVTGIPANGTAKEVTFPSKTVTWVKFQVTGGSGANVGLSEMKTYGAN